MKKIITFTFIIFFWISYSQNSNKKEFFFDENWNLIEMDVFKKKIENRKNYTYRLVENDTAYIGKILLREEFGNITKEDKIDLIKNLEKITNVEIDSTKNIVINFFFKPVKNPNGSCIDHYTSDRKYKKHFKKNKKDLQFFITQKGYEYKKKQVFEDREDFIRKLLFKYYMGCGNYIIIRNNGEFLRRLGEYRQSEIANKINSEWKKL